MTVGATVSMVTDLLTSAVVLPAASIARQVIVWLPSLSAAVVYGDAAAAKAPASVLHWKVPPVPPPSV